MRQLERATRFKRDYKRLVASGDDNAIAADLAAIVILLATDIPLAPRHRDHVLTDQWKGFRDCHVRPDTVLIHRKVGLDLLQLARLGSHSELF